MQVMRGGENRRFELPTSVDRRVAIILGVMVVAGMAGHLIFQAVSPGKARAAQSRPSTLAIDTVPAIYVTPHTPSRSPQVVQSPLQPDIDVQPHVERKHRRHRQDAVRTAPKEATEAKSAEPPKEEETQSAERIDTDEGTTFIPKRHRGDGDDPPKNPANSNFNGLDG